VKICDFGVKYQKKFNWFEFVDKITKQRRKKRGTVL